jgi:4-hydroxythreonine-4-phosphate dehydrogenase
VIVAIYHDQGLAPLKALAMGRTVNWTLGLPIVRTSVDHGTADALVGTGRASPSSMVAAIRWARRLTGRRARP